MRPPILFGPFAPPAGGVATFFMSLCALLTERGYDFRLKRSGGLEDPIGVSWSSWQTHLPDEPSSLTDLFALVDCDAQIHHVSAQGFLGSYRYHSGRVVRWVSLTPTGLRIVDGATADVDLQPFEFPLAQPLISPKYGSLLNA